MIMMFDNDDDDDDFDHGDDKWKITGAEFASDMQGAHRVLHLI